jgi:hypothetical protein
VTEDPFTRRPYRVAILGINYADPEEVLNLDGSVTVVKRDRAALRGEIVELVPAEAQRLLRLGAIADVDAPRQYWELSDSELEQLVAERGISAGLPSGQDGRHTRDDLINALTRAETPTADQEWDASRADRELGSQHASEPPDAA